MRTSHPSGRKRRDRPGGSATSTNP